MRAVVVGLGLVLATPAAAADQFDLICTAKKETVRYRVDLRAGEWCAGTCESVRKIAEVTAGTLTLSKLDPSPPNNVTAYQRVNRITGAWEWYNHDPAYSRVQDIQGTCVSAAFTDFPASKF